MEQVTPVELESACKYARAMARGLRRPPGFGIDREDVAQQAVLAVLRAARRFDRSRGVKFVTFAAWCARGEILRCYRDRERGKAPELTVSLDERWEGQDGEGMLALSERLPDPGTDPRRSEFRLVVEEAIGRLGEPDRTLLTEVVLKGRSQAVVGADLGVTQMHVSRLLRRAKAKLRVLLADR